MNQILSGFDINPITWFYVACLLAVAVYFKFTRFWTLRNLDLVALLCMTPGWLILERATKTGDEGLLPAGHVWLMVGSGWWLLRMLLDPFLRRRPFLEPNLSPPGLTFLGTALLAFMVAQVITSSVDDLGMEGVRQAGELLRTGGVLVDLRDEFETPRDSEDETAALGPAWQLMQILGVIPAHALAPEKSPPDDASGAEQEDEGALQKDEAEVFEIAARTMAILGHFAVVIGLVIVAGLHFERLVTGVGVAVLYLLLPYTDYHISRTDQILLGALLVWAVAAYRYPILSGVILAVAIGAFYLPLFLLPLWVSFYWKRGALRFLTAGGVMIVTLVGIGMATGNLAATGAHIWSLVDPENWVGPESYVWRIPVFVTFIVLSGGLALGPHPKNLGTLIAHSSVVMLGAQFLYLPYGGAHVLWYLPLVLLTVFRPNLRERVLAMGSASQDQPLHGRTSPVKVA